MSLVASDDEEVGELDVDEQGNDNVAYSPFPPPWAREGVRGWAPWKTQGLVGQELGHYVKTKRPPHPS